MLQFFVCSCSWSSLNVVVCHSIWWTFGGARAVVHHVLHLLPTLLSEFVKVGVRVADLMSMTLLLHRDPAIWIATCVFDQVFIHDVLLKLVQNFSYLFMWSVNRPGWDVRDLWYDVWRVCTGLVTAHKLLNQELPVDFPCGQHLIKHKLQFFHVPFAAIDEIFHLTSFITQITKDVLFNIYRWPM